MGHSRPQIAKEFRINERTLSWLERSGRLSLDWEPINGLMTCELTDEHRKILACSAVSLPALAGSNGITWPFHRFIILRTLQLSLDAQYQELLDRNVISETGFSVEKLTEIRDQIISRLPPTVQRFVRTNRCPETAEEKSWMDVVLDCAEIHIAYHNPDLEQSFSFMTDADLKEFVDCSISTKSTFSDIQKFIIEIAGLQISMEGLAFYQQLFHDMNLVQNAHVKTYLKTVRPSLRSRLVMAMEGSVDSFRVKSGIDDKFELDKVLTVVKNDLINRLISALNSSEPDSDKQLNYTLRNLMSVVDRIDKIRGPATKQSTMPHFLKTIQIEPKPAEKMNIFQLPTAGNKAETQ